MKNSDLTLSFDLSDVCTTLPRKIPSNYCFLPAEKQLSRGTLMASYYRSPILYERIPMIRLRGALVPGGSVVVAVAW
jgi:hypothetical protein